MNTLIIFTLIYCLGLSTTFSFAYIRYIELTNQLNSIEKSLHDLNKNVENVSTVTNTGLSSIQNSDVTYYVVFGVTLVVALGVLYLIYDPTLIINTTASFSKILADSQGQCFKEVLEQNADYTNVIAAALDKTAQRSLENHVFLSGKLDSISIKLINVESQLRLLTQPDLDLNVVAEIANAGLINFSA